MRVCIVYDCLYPYTVGGAERWYRNLSERLAAEGHSVTYLTLRQWGEDETPDLSGVSVVAVGPPMALYRDGRRRIGPPLRFGLGVLWHLIRRGRSYDVVHTASFPYFSLLAAGLVRLVHRFRLVVDWHEVWTRSYWHEYLGPVRGQMGWLVQRMCLRIPQRAFCFSRLHEKRLRDWGVRGEVTALSGQYQGPEGPPPPSRAAAPLVVFAGRHIPEKRVDALIPALALVRAEIPELRAEVLGDGPDREKVLRLIAEHGLGGSVAAPGFVDGAQVEDSLERAMCLVVPSRREGYGLVVLEAASKGTPTVVASAPDNAATELIAEGENGFVAPSADPVDLATAILKVHRAGAALRMSTGSWFEDNLPRLSLTSSLRVVLAAYGDLATQADAEPPDD